MKHESMNIRRVIRANRLLAEQGHANDTLAALDEVAALRKDAERYRWLRDAENGGELSVGQQCSVCDEYPKYEEVAWYYDIELDGLIDAAMQRAKAVGAA